MVAAALVACTSAATARQVGANGPAVLPEQPPATSVATPPANASAEGAGATAMPILLRDEAPLTRSTPVSVSGSAIDAPPATASPSESRPLGRPNGLLSARPAAPTQTQSNAGSGVLGAIDPRGNDFARVLGALAAVIGLILLTRTLLKRYAPTLMQGAGERPSGVIEILARYPLPGGRGIGRGQQLIVLKFARRILLVHQAGAALTVVSEMTDRDEVASLLSRLEAGASAKSQDKFRATLEAFESEHDSIAARQSRAGAALAAGETEIIDLTRTQVRGMSGLPRVRRLLR